LLDSQPLQVSYWTAAPDEPISEQRAFRLMVALGVATAVAFGAIVWRIVGSPPLLPPPAVQEPVPEAPLATAPAPALVRDPTAVSSDPPRPAYRPLLPPRVGVSPPAGPGLDVVLASPPPVESSVELSVRPSGLGAERGGAPYTDEDLAEIARQRHAEAEAPPPRPPGP
jgi:hypothetical protein